MIILQKGDSGFHMSASCFWDSKNDGNFSKKYPFEDYYVIINVFGFARQWDQIFCGNRKQIGELLLMFFVYNFSKIIKRALIFK